MIGVVSGKGGVGKSFVTSSLACAMNKAGYKVGIMDADITGPSIPKMFGVHGQVYGTEDGMVPMVREWDQDHVRQSIVRQRRRSDYLERTCRSRRCKTVLERKQYGAILIIYLLICHREPSDVPLTVIPVTPGRWHCDRDISAGISADDREKAYNMADMMHIPVLGVVENFSYLECPDCGKRSMFSDRAMSMKRRGSLESRYLENCKSIRLTQRKRMKENSLRSTIHI